MIKLKFPFQVRPVPGRSTEVEIILDPMGLDLPSATIKVHPGYDISDADQQRIQRATTDALLTEFLKCTVRVEVSAEVTPPWEDPTPSYPPPIVKGR